MEKSISRLIASIKSGKSTDNFQISIQLKYLLENQLGSEEYIKWFTYIYEILKNYNLSILDYVSNLSFINQNETLANIFFEYNSKLIYLRNSEISDHADLMIRSNLLGPIAFATPEIGRWSTVGGLGVMVDELSQGFTKLGQEVIMISPYYEKNRKGETGYLQNDPAKFSYLGITN
jgi:starch synthase